MEGIDRVILEEDLEISHKRYYHGFALTMDDDTPALVVLGFAFSAAMLEIFLISCTFFDEHSHQKETQ